KTGRRVANIAAPVWPRSRIFSPRSLTTGAPMLIGKALQAHLARLRAGASHAPRSSTVAAIAFGLAAVSLGIAEAAVHSDKLAAWRPVPSGAAFTAGSAPQHFTVVTRRVWEGADLDGDGQPDI